MLHTNVHSWYAHDTSFGSARPSVEKIPNLALPFYPRSCGCFSYNRGFRRVENGAHKPMVHLFWGISGSGSFETVHGNFRFCGYGGEDVLEYFRFAHIRENFSIFAYSLTMK